MQTTRNLSNTPKILLAACDVELRAFYSHTLSHSGYDVCVCHDPATLLESVTDTGAPGQMARFDLVACEVELLKDAATQVLADLQHRGGLPPLVLLCRVASMKDTALARRLSAAAVLESSLDSAQQLALVREIVPVARPPTIPTPPC